MSMKSSGRNPAQMSHTSKTLPLMSSALERIIRRGLNRRGDNNCEGLEDYDGGVQFGGKERGFRPIWKDEAGSYRRGIK